MKNKYVVISLFNGMGCAWVALELAKIPVIQKISSEVDKHAIKINNAMYPDTIQVGDVRKIEVVRKQGGGIRLETEKGSVDLLDGEIILAGGSPCQSFSMAGKRKGMITKDEIEVLTLDHYMKLKGEGFEFEGQSYLFWEYMRLKKELNPKYFLLENVIMTDKWKAVLSRAIGINPIRINADLVSAQSRDRYFWTDICSSPQGLFGDIQCMIPPPKDRGLVMRDILENDVDEKYFLKDKQLKMLNRNPDLESEGSICVAMRGRNPENPKSRESGLPTQQMIEPRYDGKTNCLTTVTKDNLVMSKNPKNVNQINECKESGGKQPYQQNRVYDIDGIAPALCAKKSDLNIKVDGKKKKRKHQQDDINNIDGKARCLVVGSHGNSSHFTKTEIKIGDFRSDEGIRWRENGKSPTLMARAREDAYGNPIAEINSRIRRLTPRECGRLQSFPEDKLDIIVGCGVAETKLYHAFGNGWNCEVISYIFSFIK